MMIPSETTQIAWARLFCSRTIAHESVEATLKEAGLPPVTWYDVLWELERSNKSGQRACDLQSRMLMPQYGISRLINKLESEGLIARQDCAEDGRGQIVSITQKGLDLRKKMWSVYGPAIENAMGAKLSDEETKQLATLLGKLTSSGTGREK
ncbi:MarR family winged helix-turn-helix transcriptional regulator [Maritalea sp.]|uniref:MarR family winged helix-turn-helix transcriptional regulator n=1 Tax=Maritalea sp. TaxID=2003361 RepID=UPI003EF1D658